MTEPDRNVALWNIYNSYLVHISEKEFIDPIDRALFSEINNELSGRNKKHKELYGEFASQFNKYTGMRRQTTGKVSLAIFKLFVRIEQKYLDTIENNVLG